mmetsp:Transcript_11137/g.23492  ORF Transcript_11137/g.23492 Transcript_11137/m.23492 type:complete len:103 (-) Transcript_11137:36-344(-)
MSQWAPMLAGYASEVQFLLPDFTVPLSWSRPMQGQPGAPREITEAELEASTPSCVASCKSLRPEAAGEAASPHVDVEATGTMNPVSRSTRDLRLTGSVGMQG